MQELLGRLAGGQLERVSGARAVAFAHWLRKHLMITETVRGSRKVASYCPIHPALSLATNAEGRRVDAFVRHLAGCFSPEERQRLQERLWDPERQPAFERVVFELLSWQLPPGDPAPPASCPPTLIENAEPGTPDGILLRAKEDLLALLRGRRGRRGVRGSCRPPAGLHGDAIPAGLRRRATHLADLRSPCRGHT